MILCPLSIFAALKITFEDYSLVPGTKTPLQFLVHLDPFKVFQTDGESSTLKEEADSYPEIKMGDTIRIEFRCLKDSMQVYVQGEFAFSTSDFHPDGNTPNPRNIKVVHSLGIEMITNTIRYGKCLLF